MTRRVRGQPQKGRPVVLTERDYELLALVGACRYLSTAQIAREFFPSEDRCRRRLRQLLDARLIRVMLVSSTEPNLVSLTSRGLAEVMHRDPASEPLVRLPGPIRLGGVAHHLLVADARLYIGALARSRGERLTAWSSGRTRRAEALGFTRLVLEPDGIAEIATDRGALVLAVEADTGTERAGVLERKLDRYGRAFDGHAELDELWFVLSSGAERHATVASLAGRAGLTEVVRLLPSAALTVRPVLPVGRAARMADTRPDFGPQRDGNA